MKSLKSEGKAIYSSTMVVVFLQFVMVLWGIFPGFRLMSNYDNCQARFNCFNISLSTQSRYICIIYSVSVVVTLNCVTKKLLKEHDKSIFFIIHYFFNFQN